MRNINLFTFLTHNSKVSIATAAVITILVIIDLLATRQVLYLDNSGQTALFILTVIIAYGIGSWILLSYTKHITRDLGTKSFFVKITHWGVTVIQFSLFGILLFVIYDNIINCPAYFSLCNTSRLPITLVYAISTLGASVIMGFLAIKFFSSYRSNKRNFIVLLYGLAAAALTISIAGDAIDKIGLLQVVEEKSPPGAIPQSSYIYETIPKYHGEVEYKVVNPHTTRLYVVPSASLPLYNEIIYITSDAPYILTWAGTFMLLRYYYKRTGKLNLRFWLILSIPLILYLVGSGLIFSLPANIPYKFYYRLIFRAGTIGSSVLFGLAFYVVSRKLTAARIKDYLAISAMGIVPIGIANEISALQQTYGVTSHSLVLIASYLFTIGLYSLIISISQDSSLRKSIRNSALEVSKLADVIEGPTMEQEIERRVLTSAREQEEILIQETGIRSSLTEHEMKQYLGAILKEIKILKNVDEILKKGKEILESSIEFLVCSRFGGLRLVYNNYFDLYTKVLGKYKKKEHKGIRMVTSITDKDSANLTRKFLEIGVHVRHAKNMPPIDFAVSDKEMIATIEKTEGGEENIKSLLVSNEYPYITHFVSIFEELWKDGTDARDRIKIIEENIEPEIFEVIADPQKASQILLDLAKSVKREAIFLLPADKSMKRVDNLGVIDHLIKASQKGATVRVICPVSEENIDIVKRISTSAPHVRILSGHNSTSGFLIVDGERFIRAELREPSAKAFSQAIGFTLYSNSKGSVDSFRSVFELLWNEHMINEQLQKTDEMQKEFIHIAAHELRNPIQPILGISEVMRAKITDPEQIEMLDVTIRNAKRLRRLTEDILDVSKIESQKPLQLNKEEFNLTEFLQNTVGDFKKEISRDNDYNNSKNIDPSIKLEVLSSEGDIINVHADKSRINQVITNLLSNAVKFTNQGNITITAQKTNDGIVIISVKDSGSGIDPGIMPRLFTKFATRSASGTGLGLFISKGIIESHGGRIWAQNNLNGKGATFSFSLHLST
ncbi:MAG TPA: ATP-binding protein [Candidatus Nitrosopolaris sp.]|nr:ATP-binding protein [Candidatus Nitrosopolaris sp.]